MSIKAHLSNDGTKVMCGAKGCPHALAYVQTLTHTGTEIIEIDPWSERWGGTREVHFPLDGFTVTVAISNAEPRELQPGETVCWVMLESGWVPDNGIWYRPARVQKKLDRGYTALSRAGTLKPADGAKASHAQTITPRQRPVMIRCPAGTLNIIDDTVVPGWLPLGSRTTVSQQNGWPLRFDGLPTELGVPIPDLS